MEKEILIGLIVTILGLLVAWAAGIPSKIARWLWRNFQNRRLIRRISIGLFDEKTIESAVEFYVRPMYSNLDPANESEPSHALINARADLFGMFDHFLEKRYSDQRHILILADSGMGKTAFLLNYFNHNYRFTNLRKQKIKLVSLAQSVADRMIDEVLISDRAELNLFLDALDEDPKALGRVEERIQEILSASEGFRTVTITCRSQFFRSDSQIPISTGVKKSGPVPLNQTKHYEFIRAYLSPFDDKQIDSYLRRRFPGLVGYSDRKRALDLVRRIPSLSVRPMLLSHMPDMLNSGAKIELSIDVYAVMVNTWANRESSWINSLSLLRLSERLATDLYLNRLTRNGEFIEPNEIEIIAQDIGMEISSDLVTSRSLLNRTYDGKYKFAHRSIMEYFFVTSLMKRKPNEIVRLTDQMARFLVEYLGCWSDDMQSVIAFCNTEVEFVDPTRVLGQPANFCLYNVALTAINTQSFLYSKFSLLNGTTRALNVAELIADMSRSCLGVEPPQIREIRMTVVRKLGGQSTYAVNVSAWVNSYAAITDIEVPSSCLPNGVKDLVDRDGELVLTCSPRPDTSELWRGEWLAHSKVAYLPTYSEGPDISAFNKNSAAGALFDADTNTLRVRILRLPMCERPLSRFGIFGEATGSTVRDRPYLLLSAADKRVYF